MVKIIRNVCHQSVLDLILDTVAKSESWHWRYPIGIEFDKKHIKLDIVEPDTGKTKDHFLTGLASSVLLQVWEANNRELFIPEMIYAGVAIKDRHRKDNVHTDDAHRDDTIKILGILNNDWDPETMGGGFMHDGVVHKLRPTDFCIFDPRIPHAADDIICNKKRFALDFSVPLKPGNSNTGNVRNSGGHRHQRTL